MRNPFIFGGFVLLALWMVTSFSSLALWIITALSITALVALIVLMKSRGSYSGPGVLFERTEDDVEYMVPEDDADEVSSEEPQVRK